MQKVVIAAFALKDECFDVKLPGCKVVRLITGLGKAKAAISLAKAIVENNPDFVINIGTAGSIVRQVGDIVVSNHFTDRDMMRLKDFGAEYETTTIMPPMFGACSLGHSSAAILGKVNTGDDFVTSGNLPEADAIDMEAYAMASCCNAFGKPFVSVKCITDIVGQNSIKHWEDKIEEAKSKLAGFFESISQA